MIRERRIDADLWHVLMMNIGVIILWSIRSYGHLLLLVRKGQAGTRILYARTGLQVQMLGFVYKALCAKDCSRNTKDMLSTLLYGCLLLSRT